MTSTGTATDGCREITPFSSGFKEILHRLPLQAYATTTVELRDYKTRKTFYYMNIILLSELQHFH
jgi:hypothetical protein